MVDQAVSVSHAGYLTYREAAAEFGLSADYIAHLVSDGRLQSVRLPHSRYKYLPREEVDRFARVRAGLEPEVEAAPVKPYADMPQSTAGVDVGQLMPGINLEQLTGEKPATGLALLLLVFFLFLALFNNQQPDQQALERLRATPQLPQVRKALLKLASEIAA